jgi:hypothetical protein
MIEKQKSEARGQESEALDELLTDTMQHINGLVSEDDNPAPSFREDDK